MKTRYKPILVILVIILLFVSLAMGVRIFENSNNEEVIEEYDDSYNPYTIINNKKYKMKDNIEVILCVGLDTYELENKDDYTNDNFADFVTLLVLDNEKKTTLPIQINRDTMCEIDVLGIGGKIAGKTIRQLAFAHTYGSGDLSSLVNVKDAVATLLHDIKVDYYLSLTMDAVPTINDDVGGVEVYVEDDFSNIDNGLKMGEYVTLSGKQALTYVRSRSGLEDSSNLNRMKRQRVYLRSLYDKCKVKQNDEKFVYDILSDINDNLLSNTTLADLSDLGNTLIEYDLLDSITLDGESKVGERFNEYYIDQKTIDDMCIRYLFKEVIEEGE
ncbi:MAG: LCP family protein [Erysipelotrichaceae bacterium]|nr:LCP family protein [Erysipelotrichaceae bacterium]